MGARQFRQAKPLFSDNLVRFAPVVGGCISGSLQHPDRMGHRMHSTAGTVTSLAVNLSIPFQNGGGRPAIGCVRVSTLFDSMVGNMDALSPPVSARLSDTPATRSHVF